jgi:gas vesicle protein
MKMKWKMPKLKTPKFAAPNFSGKFSRKKKSWIPVGWTFFAGLGVGAAIGMVIAPKSGAELRDDLGEFARDSYEQGRERLQPVIDEARERLEPVIQETRERVEPVIDSVRGRVEAVQSQASDVSDRIIDKASDLKEQVLHAGLLAILNEWPHERLIAIDGIGPVLASKIIKHRPYGSEEELVSAKYLPPSAIESLRKAA